MLSGRPHHGRIDVDSNNPHTGRPEQQARQLPQQP